MKILGTWRAACVLAVMAGCLSYPEQRPGDAATAGDAAMVSDASTSGADADMGSQGFVECVKMPQSGDATVVSVPLPPLAQAGDLVVWMMVTDTDAPPPSLGGDVVHNAAGTMTGYYLSTTVTDPSASYQVQFDQPTGEAGILCLFRGAGFSTTKKIEDDYAVSDGPLPSYKESSARGYYIALVAFDETSADPVSVTPPPGFAQVGRQLSSVAFLAEAKQGDTVQLSLDNIISPAPEMLVGYFRVGP